jgi:hypothetical protein
MPSPIVEGAGFSGDIVAFLKLLASKRVHYLIVGGEAVIYHGYPRVTGDIDFFYENTAANTARLFDVLLEFWGRRIPGIRSADDLREAGVIFQFGRPPHRIDLMNQIDGVQFPEAWRERVSVRLATDAGLVPVTYIGARSLLANKEAAARPKDLEDATFLRAKSRTPRRRS